jgi:hypothetical protein
MAILSTGRRRPSPRDWRGLARAGLILGCCLLAGRSNLSAQTAAAQEYRIKAIFLLHFAHFVQWPAAAWGDPQAPLVIGVLGSDPFGGALDQAVLGEKLGTHPLLLQRYRRVQDIGACHILFISQSEAGQLDGILATLRGRSILTVGDTEAFAQRGGMICFVTVDQKIRLQINLAAAQAAALTIDSRLLRSAKIVVPGKG